MRWGVAGIVLGLVLFGLDIGARVDRSPTAASTQVAEDHSVYYGRYPGFSSCENDPNLPFYPDDREGH